jgi:hypothetical protein
LPGSPAHLIRRFFDVATSQPLTSAELDDVSGWVSEDLRRLFLAQDSADQRHGYHAARSVISAGFADPEVIEASLLHDIGKRHADLGLVGRSMASLLILLGLPMTSRMRAYRDHGAVGSGELSETGAGVLAVEFAKHHHGARPSSIDPDVWDALIAADQPPKTRRVRTGQITSGH